MDCSHFPTLIYEYCLCMDCSHVCTLNLQVLECAVVVGCSAEVNPIFLNPMRKECWNKFCKQIPM